MRKIFYIAIFALSLTACQKELVETKVFGRYVPERKDDFAWENEYAAFRMYGPALRPENPSNGVDLWLKTSPELVVDSFYYRENVLGLPYHINYGKGLDCYKVGHTCGAGGLVVMPMSNRQLYVGGAYDRWQIIEQTPERLVFKLEYDSLMVDDHILKESITITAQAGTAWNKAQVVLTGDYDGELMVGGGIYMHDTVDNIETCDHCGMIAYAEDALSDKHAAELNYEYNGSRSQGRVYIAVMTPGPSMQGRQDGVLYTMQPYNVGDTLTYYFAAGWSEWSNGEKKDKSDEEWFESFKQMDREL